LVDLALRFCGLDEAAVKTAASNLAAGAPKRNAPASIYTTIFALDRRLLSSCDRGGIVGATFAWVWKLGARHSYDPHRHGPSSEA
jgi:hypothetical protein